MSAGPPVVLVHGITASTDWWRPTVAALEPDHDVHVVRLPGFRYREAASWLGEWQEEHGLNGASVVGHSMGGTVALALALAIFDRAFDARLFRHDVLRFSCDAALLPLLRCASQAVARAPTFRADCSLACQNTVSSSWEAGLE